MARTSVPPVRRAGIALPGASQNATPLLMWAALTSVYLIWGSTYLAIRVAVRTAPPMLFSGVRFIVAGGVLYAFAIRRGDRVGDKPGFKQWRAATIIGATLILGGNGLVVVAEQHITSSIAALIIALVPLWMALLGFAVYRERLTWPAVVGIVLGFAGVGVLVQPHGSDRISALGVALLVCATVSWASGSLYTRRAPLPRRPLVATAMEMLAGGVLQVFVGVARGELSGFRLGQISGEGWLSIAYLIVFGSLIAFTAYAWLLRVARTPVVATYAYVNPVVAVFLGWLILSEPISARTLLAGAIIIFGVALIVTARAARPATSEPAGSPADTPPPSPEK